MPAPRPNDPAVLGMPLLSDTTAHPPRGPSGLPGPEITHDPNLASLERHNRRQWTLVPGWDATPIGLQLALANNTTSYKGGHLHVRVLRSLVVGNLIATLLNRNEILESEARRLFVLLEQTHDGSARSTDASTAHRSGAWPLLAVTYYEMRQRIANRYRGLPIDPNFRHLDDPLVDLLAVNPTGNADAWPQLRDAGTFHFDNSPREEWLKWVGRYEAAEMHMMRRSTRTGHGGGASRERPSTQDVSIRVGVGRYHGTRATWASLYERFVRCGVPVGLGCRMLWPRIMISKASWFRRDPARIQAWWEQDHSALTGEADLNQGLLHFMLKSECPLPDEEDAQDAAAAYVALWNSTRDRYAHQKTFGGDSLRIKSLPKCLLTSGNPDQGATREGCFQRRSYRLRELVVGVPTGDRIAEQIDALRESPPPLGHIQWPPRTLPLGE